MSAPRRRQPNALSIPVEGGGCSLEFSPGWSTGKEGGTRPGIGFEFLSQFPAIPDKRGGYWAGSGVISRSNARKLADALHTYLAQFPDDVTEAL